MACNFCGMDLYIKTIKYVKSAVAPVTVIGELRQRLEELTGDVYVQIPNNFCPVCGEKLSKEGAVNAEIYCRKRIANSRERGRKK